MRVLKKDLKVLGSIHFDSRDYNIFNENGEYLWYDNTACEEDLNYITETINSTIEDYFIVSGNSGTWQGPREIAEGFVTDFQSVLDRLSSDIDDITIQWDDEEKGVLILGHHHDGVNAYWVRKPEWYSKKELREIMNSKLNSLEGNFKEWCLEDIQNYLKEYWECTLPTAPKEALKDVLQTEILEDYD
jgi:hypothetical protein